jgi:hypothetical protein
VEVKKYREEKKGIAMKSKMQLSSKKQSIQRKTTVFAIIYLSTVFIFACIYWVVWYFSSDFFIISEDFNLFPIYEMKTLYTDGKIEESFENVSSGLNDLYEKVKERKRLYIILAREKAKLDSLSRVTKLEADSSFEQLDQAISSNFGKYFEQETRPYVLKKAAIEEKKAKITSDIEKGKNTLSSIDLSQLEVERSELELELAKLEYAKSTKEYELYGEVLRNRLKFQDANKLHKFRHAQSLQKEAEKQYRNAKESLDSLQVSALYSWSEMHSERVKRLGILDFFYFSIGISTTATFGDIIPNHRTVRLLVALQLVLSVLIVGILITVIGDTIIKSKAEESRQAAPL